MESDRRDPDVRFVFDRSSAAPAQARRVLRKAFDDADDPIADDVRLAASELVSNAVLYTDDGGEMRMWDPKPDVPLRLEVEDHDPELPAVDAPPTFDVTVGGRGLQIVRRVSDAFGAFRTRAGKVVWAEFDRIKRRRQPGS